MSDIKNLLDKILKDEKLMNSKAFHDKVYTDIPIIRTASQMVKSETPLRIKAMKGIAFTPEAYWKTSAWLFVTQGNYMIDFEDSFDYDGDFVQYYPTYRELTTEQLRGYFTWRTAVRKGEIKKSPLPFQFIYIYELLNGIGAEHGEENFRRIDKFCNDYSVLNPKLSTYRSKWLLDYAVYHDLDNNLLGDIGECVNEKHIITLMEPDKHTDDELYTAICAMSSYSVEESRFAQDNGDIFKNVLCRSFRLMSDLFMKYRKNPFWVKLFGNISETACRLFDNAVFYDTAPNQNREYIVNDIHSYICRNGKWFCKRMLSSRNKSAKLGEFVKAVDFILRNEYDYKYKLTVVEVSKQDQTIIKNAVAECRNEQKNAAAMKIEIDISKLGAIRKSADETREKLLVDEEEQEDIIEIPVEETPVEDNSDCPLNNAEIIFVSTLISGGDYDAKARENGSMTSVLADSVNEKLFDIIGDTAIVFEGDIPVILEDYIDDVKEIVHIKEN